MERPTCVKVFVSARGWTKQFTSFAISDILTNSSQAQPRIHAMFSWLIVVFSFQEQVNWKLLCMNVRLNHYKGAFASGYRNRKAILPPNVWSIGQFLNLFRLLLLLLRHVKRRGSNKGRSNNKGRPRHFSLNAKPGEKVSLEGHEPGKVVQETQKKISSGRIQNSSYIEVLPISLQFRANRQIYRNRLNQSQ